MRIYTVHILARSASDDGAALFVKEGFSWPAFLFTVFWSLWHGMWVASAGFIALSLVLGGIGALVGLSDTMALLLQGAVHFGAGVLGNDMRRWSLRREGFVESAVVTASRRIEAEQRYFTALFAGSLDRP